MVDGGGLGVEAARALVAVLPITLLLIGTIAGIFDNLRVHRSSIQPGCRAAWSTASTSIRHAECWEPWSPEACSALQLEDATPTCPVGGDGTSEKILLVGLAASRVLLLFCYIPLLAATLDAYSTCVLTDIKNTQT